MVSLCTTRNNLQEFYIPPTVYLCAVYESQDQQRPFTYIALANWFFITETKIIYCAVGNLNLYKFGWYAVQHNYVKKVCID